MPGSISVVAYRPEWPHLFDAERSELERLLARWLEGGIHHIGSTAVPGLAAKPIIDMLGGVRDLEEARVAFEPLRALGYEYREHRPEAHLFVKERFGIHLTEPGSDLWRERLAFRDALRANPELAARYAEWKRIHASRGRSLTPYTADKLPFVREMLAAEGIAVKPDEERLVRAALAAKRRP